MYEESNVLSHACFQLFFSFCGVFIWSKTGQLNTKSVCGAPPGRCSVLREVDGEAEVRELGGRAVVRDEDVLGLDVAVHDADRVQMRDGGHDGADHATARGRFRAEPRQRGAAAGGEALIILVVQQPKQVAAVGELQHEVHVASK
jgi:hypothetical protein